MIYLPMPIESGSIQDASVLEGRFVYQNVLGAYSDSARVASVRQADRLCGGSNRTTPNEAGFGRITNGFAVHRPMAGRCYQ